MNKINKILENYNVEKSAKKYGRSFGQQEYRDNLAKTLKARRREEQKNKEKLRKQGFKHKFTFDGKPSSKRLLLNAKETPEYVDSLRKGKKVGKDVAEKLLKGGNVDVVIRNIDKFEGLDGEVIRELSGEGYSGFVVEHLDRFEGLDKDTAVFLLLMGYGRAIKDQVDRFEGVDEEIMNILIDISDARRGGGEKLNKDAINKLENAGFIDEVVNNIDYFDGLTQSDYKEIAKSYLDAVENIHDFLRIDGFKGLDKEIAEKFIEKGYSWVVARNPFRFEGLDEDIAKKLTEEGYGKDVKENSERFRYRKEK